MKAHKFVQQWLVFFVSSFPRNFSDQFSSNFHRLVILCLCWDTPSDKTGLQLPNVYLPFNDSKSLLALYMYYSARHSSQRTYLLFKVVLPRTEYVQLFLIISTSCLFVNRWIRLVVISWSYRWLKPALVPRWPSGLLQYTSTREFLW